MIFFLYTENPKLLLLLFSRISSLIRLEGSNLKSAALQSLKDYEYVPALVDSLKEGGKVFPGAPFLKKKTKQQKCLLGCPYGR